MVIFYHPHKRLGEKMLDSGDLNKMCFNIKTMVVLMIAIVRLTLQYLVSIYAYFQTF